MSSSNQIQSGYAEDCYPGFSLRDVTWGYRAIFKEAIENLFQEKCLGRHRPETTRAFFRFLNNCSELGADYVIDAFLKSLTPNVRWISGLPDIFSALLDTGLRLTRHRISSGYRFFELLGDGAMGDSPDKVKYCLHTMRYLEGNDPNLPLAFLAGYRNLRNRMTPREIDRYIEAALQIHQAREENGYAFLRGELNSSETYILSITQECRLCDSADALKALLYALADEEFEIHCLENLDSDDLIMRGSRVVQTGTQLYLPASIRAFKCRKQNRNYYTLCAITAASMLLDNSFPCLHGCPEYRDASALCGSGQLQQNLFLILEAVRILRATIRRWPGARNLIFRELQRDLAQRLPDAPEQILLSLVSGSELNPQHCRLLQEIERCKTCFETVELITDLPAKKTAELYPTMEVHPISPFSFLSDFFFPGRFADPLAERGIIGTKREKKTDKNEDASPPEEDAAAGEIGKDLDEPKPESSGTSVITFVYDEWDFLQSDYRLEWCSIRQSKPDSQTLCNRTVPAEWKMIAGRVRRLFERLKPELIHREKYLSDGDTINIDRLVEYMVDSRQNASPPVRFYEKPLINHRDPSVLILLDLSGSTASEIAGNVKILDLEKEAGVILGEGLNTLDDRFAVCGFNSFGREQCHYLVFKDFEDRWSVDTIARLMSSRSRNSTRIGPALRHSVHLIANQPTKQKLILLITDGKPVDKEYDPVSRYAQHDVRMACEEALQKGIHIFAVSTEENSAEDMDLMFPNHRYVLLPDISRLPAVLPRLYMQLTK